MSLRPPTTNPLVPSRRRFVATGGALAVGALLPEIAWGASSAPVGLVAPGARLVEVFSGGRWCEGPAWDPRARTLVFSDVRGNRILRLAADGRIETIRDPSDFANGNAFDREGRLVTCEHLGRRVVREERDGSLTVLADRYRGRRLNAPNDVIVARDGAVWFTDPTFGLEQPEEGRQGDSEQPGRFVFRIARDGRLAMVTDVLEQPNGLAFSPDERTLYVSDTSGSTSPEGKREILAFDVRDGRLANERLFARVPSGVPDGLEVDAAGRVYAATDRGATVWDATGRPLGDIATPVTCGNLAFGGAGGRSLFLCNGSSVHRIGLTTRGATFA